MYVYTSQKKITYSKATLLLQIWGVQVCIFFQDHLKFLNCVNFFHIVSANNFTKFHTITMKSKFHNYIYIYIYIY